MEFHKAVKELESRGSDRKEPSLKSTAEVLEQLGRPDRDYKVVLVGGTNGKGSTVEMVSEGLQQLGFSVGVNKSPHLVDLRERIRLNSKDIGREEFLKLYNRINRLDSGQKLSFFEFITVMAYLHFSEKSVDYAVMEVGMGGRLDATNAAEPVLSAITNIEKDHTSYLGDTEEEIAREKAGIIPENGTVVSRDNGVIDRVASDRGARLVRPLELQSLNGRYIYNGQRFSIPVAGSFQKQNLETALTVLEQLESIPTDLEKTFSGLECPGRMETVSKRPLCIHDGAHNPAALEAVIGDLPKEFICVFNALKTKDIPRMIDALENRAVKFYLTKSGAPWAEEPDNIARHVSKPFEVVQDCREAVEQAMEEAGDDGSVVVTGSIYLIGDVRKTAMI